MQKFKPAKPSSFLLWLAQKRIARELQASNVVHISPEDEAKLAALPANSGLILTPNHADEVDPLICIDLSRRCHRRFIFMCNREAFSEYHGLAGLGLQGLGYFSVERGGHDVAAKAYSIEVVKGAREVLVIFPEGEIFYLNQSLQPFHSGAVDIAMQAILEKRKSDPAWTAYLIPLAIRYTYDEPIESILESRIEAMENKLHEAIEDFKKGSTHLDLPSRLTDIQSTLLDREEKNFQIKDELLDGDRKDRAAQLARLSVRIAHARETILQQIEAKGTMHFRPQTSTIDQAWAVSAHLREKLGHHLNAEEEKELKGELAALNEVAQLASWRPQYVGESPTNDRMAEMVLKLERELYRIKRPKQLAKRRVYLHVGDPIDIGAHLNEYQSDPHAVRHKIATQLRDEIQKMVLAAID